MEADWIQAGQCKPREEAMQQGRPCIHHLDDEDGHVGEGVEGLEDLAPAGAVGRAP
jgi:hypothetical protein